MSASETPRVPLWNIANILTMTRMVMVPIFVVVAALYHEDIAMRWVIAGIFVLAMVTDFVDGYLARSRNLITDFGKIADPIADKALMTTALVCLNIVDQLSVWVTVIILIREFGITIWRMALLRRGKVVPASKGGKLKTVLQSFAVGLYLWPLPSWMDIPTSFIMWMAVVVTVITGVQYLIDGQKQNS